MDLRAAIDPAALATSVLGTWMRMPYFLVAMVVTAIDIEGILNALRLRKDLVQRRTELAVASEA